MRIWREFETKYKFIMRMADDVTSEANTSGLRFERREALNKFEMKTQRKKNEKRVVHAKTDRTSGRAEWSDANILAFSTDEMCAMSIYRIGLRELTNTR